MKTERLRLLDQSGMLLEKQFVLLMNILLDNLVINEGDPKVNND